MNALIVLPVLYILDSGFPPHPPPKTEERLWGALQTSFPLDSCATGTMPANGNPNAKSIARKERLYSRREIEGLIADGRKIIILDQKVIKADAWIDYHPGGHLAILHMVGRDATDEVNS